jgi:phosphoenolpyruvate-protein kinase (PTS system EI component)
MVEIPAAALSVASFLRHFDFVSLGTNDLIQYTLAIDRTDDAVAHLYDPLHPAVLTLVANTIQTATRGGMPVARRVVRETNAGQMARLAARVLTLGTVEEIERFLNDAFASAAGATR